VQSFYIRIYTSTKTRPQLVAWKDSNNSFIIMGFGLRTHSIKQHPKGVANGRVATYAKELS